MFFSCGTALRFKDLTLRELGIWVVLGHIHIYPETHLGLSASLFRMLRVAVVATPSRPNPTPLKDSMADLNPRARVILSNSNGTLGTGRL